MIPRARMIHTKIWYSDQVQKLKPIERLLYIGLITHGDDQGRLRGDGWFLKIQFFPNDKGISINKVEKMRDSISKEGLIIVYREKDGTFIAHPKWKQYQTLRSDRAKPSEYPAPSSDDRLTDVGQLPAQDKVGEAKVTQGNGKEGKVQEGRENQAEFAPQPSARDLMLRGIEKQKTELASKKSMQTDAWTEKGLSGSVSSLPTNEEDSAPRSPTPHLDNLTPND